MQVKTPTGLHSCALERLFFNPIATPWPPICFPTPRLNFSDSVRWPSTICSTSITTLLPKQRLASIADCGSVAD